MIRVLHTGLRLPEEREGILLTHRPVLMSEIINLDTKWVEGELDKATAISFFSPRAVNSIFDQGISLPDLPIFVVGSKTQERVSELYGHPAKAFQTFRSFSKFFDLNPEKNLVSFELKTSCHSVQEIDPTHCAIPCYETKAQSTQLSDVSSFDWVIITSPRGADSFFSQVWMEGFSGNFACLGKTTYEALKKNHNVNAVFEIEGSVTVDDLLDEIEGFQ